MKKIIAYTDGGARGNPGIAGLGVHIIDTEGNVLKEESRFLGIATNNHAEYAAIIDALKAIRSLFGNDTKNLEVEMRMDSELAQRQLTGVYKVKNPDIKKQFFEIQDMREKYFPNISFTHVRREFNKEADRLSNEAMDEGVVA